MPYILDVLVWSVVLMLAGVTATVWAFATDREHGGIQLAALFVGSTLALGGAICTVIAAVRLI